MDARETCAAWLRGCTMGFAAVALSAPAARAQNVSIPAPLRAAIVKKVISYDKALNNEPVNIVIFTNAGGSNEANELQSALNRLGLATSTIASEEELRRRGNDIKVLYVHADDASTGVRNHCRVAHCLSITGSMVFVEQGDVGVGIAAVSGKPQIAVHMRRIGEERQDLSAEMLQLARVIR
jgi:hypothetical protein